MAEDGNGQWGAIHRYPWHAADPGQSSAGFRPTRVPDDEPYRCAVGSGFDDRLVGQFTYEGKAESGFVGEALRGLDRWQVGYLVGIESSPPVSDLDRVFNLHADLAAAVAQPGEM